MARVREKPKTVRKRWADIPSGVKGLLTDLCIVAQMSILALLYAFFAYRYSLFFYLSLAFTALTAIYVAVCENDVQSKISWFVLFLLSFGCGYIVYILASKAVCYGYNRRRFAQIVEASRGYCAEYNLSCVSPAVAADCRYLYNAGGFVPYRNTSAKYYNDAKLFFDNVICRLEEAQSFIFLEYFIVADGVLFERLFNVLKRKAAEGVEIKFLLDDVGSQGVLSGVNRRRLKEAGINYRSFAPLLSLFNFGLNFRDHRKIVVVDGKTAYVGGCNIADTCTNQYRMDGMWKDAGLRLEGEAVDGLSLCFLRQWQLATGEGCSYPRYLNRFQSVTNSHIILPYAGGPENAEHICRDVYYNVICGAREKLYIMSPYFIPDSQMFKAIKKKAAAGVDVRIVLPAVPDYKFIWLVTRANAERLIKSGAKIYFAEKLFVHSKVMLTENCVTVGSVNTDMRAFYQEFDNGVYTDDPAVMADALADFEGVFSRNAEHKRTKKSPLTWAAVAFLRLFSPLM